MGHSPQFVSLQVLSIQFLRARSFLGLIHGGVSGLWRQAEHCAAKYARALSSNVLQCSLLLLV